MRVGEREEKLKVKFNMIANGLGLKNTKWARVAIIFYAFWAFLTCFVCFEKPDFLNLTFAILGLFLLLDP